MARIENAANKIDFNLPLGDEQLFVHDDIPDMILFHVDVPAFHGLHDDEWTYCLLTDWDTEKRVDFDEYAQLEDDESLCYTGIAHHTEMITDPQPWCVYWTSDYSMSFGEDYFSSKDEALEYLVSETERLYREGVLFIER